jgi:hypothetical protein
VSGVSVLGAWMVVPGPVPSIVRLLLIVTCSVYVAGWISMVSPPAALAASTAAWMVVKIPVPPAGVDDQRRE